VHAGAAEQAAREAGVPTDVVGLSLPELEWDFPVTRREAESVPAIQGALGVVAGRGSTIPLRRWGSDGEPLELGTFLTHPEPDVNRPAQRTMHETLADMALDGVAYWRVLLRDYRGFPFAAVHIAPAQVSPITHFVEGIGEVVDAWTVAGQEVPLGDVLVFRGPVPGGWRVAGARALRTALALERAAKRYAEEPVPSIVLRNESGVDLPPERVDAILDLWKKSRRDHATGYLNAALSATPIGFSARDMQLVEGRQQMVLEVSRLTGVPHGLLGAAPAGTSLTYRNLEGEAHQAFDAMHPYLAGVEQRLSQEDVTPRGQSVRFDVTALLRPDTATLVNMILKLVPLEVLEVPEARALLSLPPHVPLVEAPEDLPTPGSAPVG
jgi:hypothetical protein